MRSVMAALGSWSIIVIVIAWCLAILSQTHTHCAQPLQRSTATYAEPYLRPFSFPDRKSTRLNSSHSQISYAVFCLKKKKKSRVQDLDRIGPTATNTERLSRHSP